MNRKIMIALYSILFAALSNGCSNYKELNSISFISGMGIDYLQDKDKYEVTFQAFSPSSIPGAGATNSVVYTAEGRTISEAARNSSKKFSRSNDYSHIRLVVIGDTLAKKESLNYIFDVFERDAKIRVNIPVLIARKNSAKEIISIVPGIENPIKSINGKVKNSAELLGENQETQIYQIIEALSSKGKEPVIGGISLMNSDTPAQEGTKETKLSGVGIIREGKLVGWMDGKKAKSIQFLNNKMKQTTINIDCNHHMYTSILVSDSHSSTRVQIKNGKPVISIKTNSMGTVNEMLCNRDTAKYQVLREYEKRAAKKIKKDIISGINEAKKNKSDIFGFGEILHRDQPKQWKEYQNNWNDYFTDAEVKVDVHFLLHGTNMRIEPYPYK